ncbi:C40 family peptidase [Bacillus sp. 165]|nr:C40 family peptidase [Bacillus sp. 165]
MQENKTSLLEAQTQLQQLQASLTLQRTEKEERLRVLEQKALELQTAITDAEASHNELFKDNSFPEDGQYSPETEKELIDYAKQYIGLPYIWGSSTPTNGGFDCSGFIYWVYSHNGVDGERQTTEGYWNSVQQVRHPVPVDLVFF